VKLARAEVRRDDLDHADVDDAEFAAALEAFDLRRARAAFAS
jgi:hypothetical protein